MAYSAITTGEIDAESPVTETLMTKIVNNIDDHTHTGGAGGTLGTDTVGATQITDGSVGQAEIGASAVGQGELKTALQQATTTTSVNVVYTGGGYHTNSSLVHTASDTDATITAYVSAGHAWAVRLNEVLAGTAYWQSRYVQASPPYDIGNGDIPLFMYAIINNATKEKESISTAPDPTWAYNGRNAISPHKRYKKKGNPNYFYMKKERPDKETDFQAWRASFEPDAIITEVETEITQAVKNQDMNEVPHPFMGNDLTGKTVVLINPVSNLCDCLFEMHEEGEDVHDIIRNYLNIQNTPISGAVTPNGVMTVRAMWK